MPTETRLLYILSDLAYVAKLVPSKKAHEFTLADFHQINGEFLNEDLLIEENLNKLIAKLEAGSYKVVLPDFLFTTTVLNPELEDEAAVKKYLSDKLLPDLNIDKENFYLETSILSHYKGVFKVQLTALEKVVVTPLVKALKARSDIKIESVSPLSWTAKSVISLEPSVSILQLGRQLYLAQHYIGLDQCFHTDLDNVEKFAETVKTLKGVEPSLQTLYLLSNELVDDKVKNALKETLPVQQLADPSQESAQLPSHLKKIIEAAAKTFTVAEFLLPQFALDLKFNQEAKEQAVQDKNKDEKQVENLLKPAVIGGAVATAPGATEEIAETPLPEPSKIPTVEKESKEAEAEKVAEKEADEAEAEKTPEPKPVAEPEPALEPAPTAKVEAKTAAAPKKVIKEVDLAQFANLAIDPSVVLKKEIKGKIITPLDEEKNTMRSEKVLIKNQSEASGVLKMIFIALLSFVLTIGLGIGIGLGYLKLSNQSTDQEAVLELLTPTPTPSAEPTPTPVEINKADYNLMVVNATTKAGYAGEIADMLESAGFSDIGAKNAKGSYDTSNYLLLKSLADEEEASNAALLKELEAATDLSFELSAEIATEDSSGDYDAVLVLGE